jgi:hypothetical protein
MIPAGGCARNRIRQAGNRRNFNVSGLTEAGSHSKYPPLLQQAVSFLASAWRFGASINEAQTLLATALVS